MQSVLTQSDSPAAGMKAVILAGGLGTRISEESHLRPKPMIEIGGRPILWHIMKLYSHFGVRDFVICLGYRGYMIKEYFANYVLHNADLTVDLAKGSVEYHATHHEPWRVTLVDTGAETMTGGRLRRVASYLEPGQPFFFTYGDGVADVDVAALVAHHRAEGRQAFGVGQIDIAAAFVQRVDQPGVDAGEFAKALGDFFVAGEMRAFAPHRPTGVQRGQQVLLVQVFQNTGNARR